MPTTADPPRVHDLERSVNNSPLVPSLQEHRAALTAQCRRILGSASEAEDAVQETMLRAWQRIGELQASGSLQAWLSRIAHNVCLDMLRAPQRRSPPEDMAGDREPAAPVDDPEERAVTAEGVRQALVTALLHLPPRQRSALLLCEVLRWRASEVAELLGTSVASVNSALQRARAAVGDRHRGLDPAPGLDDEQRRLAHSYVQAFERHDVGSLAALLRSGA